MSWYVAKSTPWGPTGDRYEVRRYAPYSEADGVLRRFTARRARRLPGTGHVMERSDQVRDRAQAFCDRLNVGGADRERALHEAGADAGSDR